MSGAERRAAALAVALGALACRAAEPADPRTAAEEPAPAGGGEAAEEELPVDVVLATTYRGRWGVGRDDHDLTAVAVVDAGDPDEDPWTVHALVDASGDLDGAPDEGDDFAFFSLADTYDGAVTGRVHHLYAEAHGVDGVGLFRLGRQLVYDTPEVLYFDGVRAESEPRGASRWRVGVYGGVPTLPYQSSRAGELALGAFAERGVGEAVDVRADWMHLAGGDQLGREDSDLFQVLARWRPRTGTTFEVAHSRLGAEPRDWRLEARAFDAERDLALEARVYELLETQGELSVPLDPFFATLFELDPYVEAGAAVSKGLGDVWFVQAGAEARRIADAGDVGPYNREWLRWYATGSADEVLPGAVSLAVTLEAWDGDGDRYETFGVDLSRELGAKGDADAGGAGAWDVNAGTYYSLYKHAVYLDEEREDVRTWYAGVRRRLSDALSLRARYELERNDLDDFHTFRVGMTWEL